MPHPPLLKTRRLLGEDGKYHVRRGGLYISVVHPYVLDTPPQELVDRISSELGLSTRLVVRRLADEFVVESGVDVPVRATQ